MTEWTKAAHIAANAERATANRALMTRLGVQFSAGRKSSVRLVRVPGRNEPLRVRTNRGNGDPDRPSVVKRRMARNSRPPLIPQSG